MSEEASYALSAIVYHATEEIERNQSTDTPIPNHIKMLVAAELFDDDNYARLFHYYAQKSHYLLYLCMREIDAEIDDRFSSGQFLGNAHHCRQKLAQRCGELASAALPSPQRSEPPAC